jgi:hypothetical protein
MVLVSFVVRRGREYTSLWFPIVLAVGVCPATLPLTTPNSGVMLFGEHQQRQKDCLPGFRISDDAIPGMNIMKPTSLALFNWLVSLF